MGDPLVEVRGLCLDVRTKDLCPDSYLDKGCCTEGRLNCKDSGTRTGRHARVGVWKRKEEKRPTTVLLYLQVDCSAGAAVMQLYTVFGVKGIPKGVRGNLTVGTVL
jgi:hypothetical protein